MRLPADASEDEAEEAAEADRGSDKTRQQQQQGKRAKQQQGAAAGQPQGGQPEGGQARSKAVDYEAARSKFDLGIVNPHAQPKEEAGGRGGRGGRGGGRGEALASLVPPGKFNPYAAPELNALKGGKRSAVHVRSGNRSMTFKE